MTILETERLTIHRMTVDDMADMFVIYSNERALKFVPSPIHKTVEETQVHFENRLDSHWSIRMKGQDTVIGALNFIDTRIVGMGYIIHPDYWGQGIAVEACRGLLDYAFAHFNYDRIELWIDETNRASLRVAQKLGFQVKGRIAHKYAKNDAYHFMLVWGILKQEWENTRADDDNLPTQFYSVEPVLMVRDVVAAAEYYRDKLGFQIDFLYGEPPYHGGVSRGEWTGSIVSIQLSQVLPQHEIEPASYLHIRIDGSLDSLFELYRANGVTIIAEPDNKPWGFREFTIGDLNGHSLVFACYL